MAENIIEPNRGNPDVLPPVSCSDTLDGLLPSPYALCSGRGQSIVDLIPPFLVLRKLEFPQI